MAFTSNEFHLAAATWDDKPGRRELGLALAEVIRTHVPLDKSMSLLDFGCGTGLVLLPLAEAVGRAVGVDTSTEMLAQVRKKAESLGWTHVDTLHQDITQTELPPAAFDCVFSSMALHHVENLETVLRQLTRTLAPGGVLALVDLVTEDGSFHGPDVPSVHHHGFDPATLAETLASFGMDDIRHTVCHELEREQGTYPLFLLTAKRPTTA